MPQTREHILLSRQVGVPYIIVFPQRLTWWTTLNCWNWWKWKCAICCLPYDFLGDDTPIVTGSARLALEGDQSEYGEPAIFRLAEALDTYIPTRSAPSTSRSCPIEDVFSISGRGTVVTGRVERGIVKVGEELEIVGLKATTKTTRTGVEMFRKLLTKVKLATTWAGCCAAPSVKTLSVAGCWLLASITLHTEFEASVYVLSKDEGVRHLVLRQLPPAVLLPHHRFDRRHLAERRRKW